MGVDGARCALRRGADLPRRRRRPVWLALLGCVPLALAPWGLACPGPGRRGRDDSGFAPSAAVAGMDAAANKETAKAFYGLMFNDCRPREAIERYAGAEYVQHNPDVADGEDAFVDVLRADGCGVPGQAGRVQAGRRRGRPRRPALLPALAGDRDYAGIDIFRFDAGGRIVEHWDVLQPVPETARERQRDVLVAASARSRGCRRRRAAGRRRASRRRRRGRSRSRRPRAASPTEPVSPTSGRSEAIAIASAARPTSAIAIAAGTRSARSAGAASSARANAASASSAAPCSSQPVRSRPVRPRRRR